MILNLTQHTASPEQVAAGVVDLSLADRATVSKLLTFDTLPTAYSGTITDRALALADFASKYAPEAVTQAMIGGAPWLMASLEAALLAKGIEPLYAFSVRESVDQPQADGSVRKVNIFKHAGFIPAVPINDLL
jgi:hypothetical protein